MVLIYNARVVTMAGAIYDPGYVWTDRQKICAVGDGQPGADVLAAHRGATLDAGGGWLLPGLIDAHCHVGLFNDGLTLEGDDGNEPSDPVTPQLQAIDGLFQDDRCFGEALAHGITSVMTGPGSANVLAGRFALLRTGGRTPEDMAIETQAAMKAAFGENPKKTHGRKDRSPMTRMATASVLRDALNKASHYRDEQMRAAERGRGAAASAGLDTPAAAPAPDARWEALLPVLSGAIPLKIHAHRTDDILTAVRIANEFGLRYTLDHCTEGYRIADLLASEYKRGQESGRGCGRPGLGRLEGIIAGPLLSDRSKPELARADIRNPAIIAAAGIPLAIMTDHPVVPVQYLITSAAEAVRAGMPEESALAAITIQAARICGAASEIGSLEVGKAADMVLFSGNPFDYRSRARQVFLQGALVCQDGQLLPDGGLS